VFVLDLDNLLFVQHLVRVSCLEHLVIFEDSLREL
jgi:hypothetical protein